MSVANQVLPIDPQQFRPDFPILSKVLHDDKPLVYLDNAATTQRPNEVIQALVDTYEKNEDRNKSFNGFFIIRAIHCFNVLFFRQLYKRTPG